MLVQNASAFELLLACLYCLVINVHHCRLLSLASALLDYHVSQTLSTAFSDFFQNLFFEIIRIDFEAEKEGFEPSRRY